MRNMSSAKHNIIAAVHRYSLGGVTVAGTVYVAIHSKVVFSVACVCLLTRLRENGLAQKFIVIHAINDLF